MLPTYIIPVHCSFDAFLTRSCVLLLLLLQAHQSSVGSNLQAGRGGNHAGWLPCGLDNPEAFPWVKPRLVHAKLNFNCRTNGYSFAVSRGTVSVKKVINLGGCASFPFSLFC